MRWLLINHSPVESSGSGLYTRLLAANLARRGHAVRTLTPGPGSVRRLDTHVEETYRLRLPGLPDGEAPTFTGGASSVLTYDRLTDTQVAAYEEQSVEAVRRAVREHDADVVQSQHLFLVSRAALSVERPVIVTSHGSELKFVATAVGARFRPIARDVRAGVAGVVYVSQFVADLTSLLGDHGAVVPETVLLNAYEPVDFPVGHGPQPPVEGIDQAPWRVATGGRLVGYKRVDVAIAAAAEAGRPVGRPIELTVVGDGPARADLERRVRDLQVDARFTGFLPQREFARILRESDLFIHPSEGEPCALTILEAMASGTPTVASASGGTPELLSPEAGVLVSGWDPVDWGRGLGTVLGDLARWPRHQVHAAVRGRTWSAYAAAFDAFCARAIGW